MTTAAEQMIETFQSQLNALSAALDESDKASVLGWNNGLCVGFTAENKAYATGVLNAAVVATPDMPEEAYAFVPNVRNGHNETAQMVKRQVRIAQEIEELTALIVRCGGTPS